MVMTKIQGCWELYFVAATDINWHHLFRKLFYSMPSLDKSTSHDRAASLLGRASENEYQKTYVGFILSTSKDVD